MRLKTLAIGLVAFCLSINFGSGCGQSHDSSAADGTQTGDGLGADGLVGDGIDDGAPSDGSLQDGTGGDTSGEDGLQSDLQIDVIGNAPVIEPIGDQTVPVGSILTFKVKASDADQEQLTLSVENLPAGATFNVQTGVFSWSPGLSDVGAHPNVTFKVSDGKNTVSVTITITVTDPNAQSSDATDGTTPDTTTADTSGGDDIVGIPSCVGSAPGCGNGSCTCPGTLLCSGNSCIDPAQKPDCKTSADCTVADTYCDPSIGKCLPNAPTSCTYHPPVGVLTPQLLWHWQGWQKDGRNWNQVLHTPAVGRINDDEFPDVVVQAYHCPTAGWDPTTENCNTDLTTAVLVAISGKDGTTIWADDDPNKYLDTRGHPSLADVNHDGKTEIFAIKKGGGIIAFKSNGDVWWQNTQSPVGDVRIGAINVVDIDHDGTPELVVGFIVLDSLSGNVLWQASNTPVTRYADEAGSVFTIAHDFNGDGYPDITDGRRMYFFNPAWIGNPSGEPMYQLKWENTAIGSLAWGGSAAAGDIWAPAAGETRPWKTPFALDGIPEVIVVTQADDNTRHGRVYELRASDGKILFKQHFDGRGGSPVVADMAGNGRPEIGLAARDLLLVFDPWQYDPTSTDTDPKQDGILWTAVTQDHSSHLTSISVFDFEGDGKVEVVYNDECFLRVYNGSKDDGTPGFKRVYFEWPNSSRTHTEYPVIVDINGDNQAEIIVGANNDQIHRDGCLAAWKAKQQQDPTFTYPSQGSFGVFVFKDKFNNWVNTRKVWNQHAYHITNINDDLTVPKTEDFTTKTNNTYRANFQGEGLFNAPNFVVGDGKLNVSTSQCPSKLTFSLLVKNTGTLGVPAGLPIAFYRGTSPSGTLLGVAKTTKPLLPGSSEAISFTWDVPLADQGSVYNVYAVLDDDGIPDGSIGLYNECEGFGEDDNIVQLSNITCGNVTCQPGQGPPKPEECNGIDDDCNGKIDDGLYRPCETACGVGVETCVNGKWEACNAPKPDPEVCDGIDNNCDGQIDEGLEVNACGTCGPLPHDVCDGFDNNCDGQVDEDASCKNGNSCVCGFCAEPCINGECLQAETKCVGGYCIPESNTALCPK
ncbi:MAG: hypothetical protein KC609_01535 [Myxococcales bacterium]|nr:hypothetical protein [Myxococcales bacterium]